MNINLYMFFGEFLLMFAQCRYTAQLYLFAKIFNTTNWFHIFFTVKWLLINVFLCWCYAVFVVTKTLIQLQFNGILCCQFRCTFQIILSHTVFNWVLMIFVFIQLSLCFFQYQSIEYDLNGFYFIQKMSNQFLWNLKFTYTIENIVSTLLFSTNKWINKLYAKLCSGFRVASNTVRK